MWLFILFTYSWPYHFYHIAGVCWIKITFVTKKYRKCGCILSNNIKLIIMKKLYSAKHNSLPKQSDIFFALQLSTLLTVSHWQWYHFFTGISSLWQCKKKTVQEIQTEIQDSMYISTLTFHSWNNNEVRNDLLQHTTYYNKHVCFPCFLYLGQYLWLKHVCNMIISGHQTHTRQAILILIPVHQMIFYSNTSKLQIPHIRYLY